MQQSFESLIDNYLPGQSVDCVIIGYASGELKILLLQWKATKRWSLPGGFILKDEDMDKAALRILKERTTLEFPFIHQFYTFGNYRRRDISNLNKELAAMNINSPKVNEWFRQRFISTGYLAMVNLDKAKPQPDELSIKCDWMPADKLPPLIYDHNDIVAKALEYIKMRVHFLPVGMTLLPEKFTMNELRLLYETILQRSLDRANFQRKMLKLGVLIRLEKHFAGNAHKAPYLYKFDKKMYNAFQKEGIGFV